MWPSIAPALRQMIETNKISRESLESVQRAFVFLGETTMVRVPEGKGFAFHFRFPWVNSGSTPTKTITTHTNWQAQPNAITRDFSFPDIWNKGDPHIDQSVFVAPHGNTGNDVGPIDGAYIKAVQQHKMHLYFWGHAKYRDIFDDSPDHLTRFCVELVGFYGDPFKQVTQTERDTVLPVMNDCGFYSCADSGCK